MTSALAQVSGPLILPKSYASIAITGSLLANRTQFPSADVLGFDLSPIQPSWVPPNCKFEIEDAEKDWTFPKDSFDYIHARNLLGTIRDWPKLIKQCYDHTKPGGWLEWQHKHPLIVSDDDSLPEKSFLQQWSKNFSNACTRFGVPLEATVLLKQRMEAAGFVDVVQCILKLPIGPWPKDKNLKKVGTFELVNMVDGIEGLSIRLFSKALGMTFQEIQLHLIEVRKEAKNSKIHSYYPFYIVFGKKPEA